MSAANFCSSESSESVNVNPKLSPEAQKDLDDALGDEKKEAWVEETRRNLLRAFALGRRGDATPQKDVDIYNAVEGTEKNLRYTLVSILSVTRCNVPRITRADVWQRTLYMINMANWPCTIGGPMIWLAIGL